MPAPVYSENMVRHLTSEEIQFSYTYNECFIVFVEIHLKLEYKPHVS